MQSSHPNGESPSIYIAGDDSVLPLTIITYRDSSIDLDITIYHATFHYNWDEGELDPPQNKIYTSIPQGLLWFVYFTIIANISVQRIEMWELLWETGV